MQSPKDLMAQAIAANPYAKTVVMENGREIEPRDTEEDRMRAIRKKSGIPPRYARNVVPIHELDELVERGDGAIISGSVGVGKTHFAWGLVLAYLENHIARTPVGYAFRKTARLIPTSDLLEEIKATFDGRGSGSATEVLDRYAAYDLLVLDDLGKEIPTDWVRSKLYSLVNRRYNACRATVVTSQYDIIGLKARLSQKGGADEAEAICSRLNEMCPVKQTMHGPDIRAMKAGRPVGQEWRS